MKMSRTITGRQGFHIAPSALYRIRTYLRFLASGRCLDFPLVVQMQTHSYCQGSCAICPYPEVSRSLDQGFMDEGLFAAIAAQLATEPLFSRLILHLQNEPLIDGKIFERVKYFKLAGPGRQCSLVTNGELLDNFSLAEIAASGIDRLVISLNAYSKETYEAINRGLDYDRVVGNVERLASDPAMRPKMALSFVLLRDNAREVREAASYWRNRGVETRLVALSSRGGSLAGYESFRPQRRCGWPSLTRVCHTLKSGLPAVVGCHRPFSDMCILYNGDVVICCQDWERAVVVGNANESSLREIWNSVRMQEVRRLLWNRKYGELAPCRRCSLVKLA